MLQSLAMLRRMTQPNRTILFSVKAHETRFPPELWQRFKERTAARGETWIDTLRALIERYLKETEQAQ